MSDSIQLQVNGEVKTCSPHTKLPDFLEQMGLNPRLVAVEYNGEILHRQFWETTEMKAGDVLEIVTIVGGGMTVTSDQLSLIPINYRQVESEKLIDF
ncbi:sulfur carrier protein ThiS [Limnoraphis robusta]|uniref:Sulfur carrier protein ThiS n=1 Tax=Limnoraphis robusta CCNP1315 TaxID=3110306 RepID=A0ABU5U3Z5_9CYAN|nr:sulfur carrier protein ThiS [Limnoraphis robusta]MEA5521906.1 sulfur carrier protein ThiS [Limnoraphis robusta CCNP1315]MEA5545318.1 sulfur carrier protein ThiS [Limnoraphis robusta CCNP1324]